MVGFTGTSPSEDEDDDCVDTEMDRLPEASGADWDAKGLEIATVARWDPEASGAPTLSCCSTAAAFCGPSPLPEASDSTMTHCSHEQCPYQLLSGEPHISEELLGLKFRISPDAFLQVNTAGAEVLYQTIGEMIRAHKDTVLLDICCGTGAIGLSLAEQVSKVIGVEVVDQAVEDARWNAAFNGVSNCEFHSGKAEVVLPQLLMSWPETQPLTAVVNPSRAGLHYRVVRAIRNCEAIRRLVYVSCKPEGEAMRNFLEFCCPPDTGKKLKGEAFAPVSAVPVDLFPHTSHCELLLLLAR
ncbi:PREDICTED: tRNA (uracil(54)-C(5))-methyltransferase homolog [Gekko japonicus]|uniref:tRNA (uracil(54)-C(5))-methyltransferase n=1 Tax=Gekko japonicus TaxID=146911 RepID=A0ABM1L9X5_GEKJA|nr:PREDICTED: tRNA (uracil(54)-C(5))-methyltransferase homolog [Gekko japonicus]